MRLLETLFNPSELVCLGRTIWDTASIPMDQAMTAELQFPFFCINPLLGSRSDSNCSAFRNFLLEFDKVPLDEQIQLVKESGMPFTSCTFSGGKSYHFIIALTESLATKAEYNHVARWLFKIFEVADQSTGNPSRFSRLPGAVRVETGLEQKLIEIKERVPNAYLMEWLESHAPMPTPLRQTERARGIKRIRNIRNRTRRLIKYGAPHGQRTTELFVASCNLRECGFNEAEIVSLIEPVIVAQRWDGDKWRKTIRGAVDHVKSR